jgi:hypothetical protein
MGEPYRGILQVPDAPLRNAIASSIVSGAHRSDQDAAPKLQGFHPMASGWVGADLQPWPSPHRPAKEPRGVARMKPAAAVVPKPALLAALLGSAWLLSATLAQAGPASAPQTAAAPAPVAPDAVSPEAGSPAIQAANARAAPSAGVAAAAEVQLPAVAPVAPGQWRFSISPYLWMASVKTSATFSPANTGRIISADVHQSFGDIFKDLNFAIMAGAEARRGLFSLQLDAIYINLLQKNSGVRDISGPQGLEVPVNVGGKLRLQEGIATLTGGYDIFRNDRGFVQLFGGFRYLGLRSTLDWSFAGPLGNLARAGSVDSQSDIWNGVAGLRGEHALGDGPWKAIYYVDVGAGGSRLTWQALAQVAYVRRWGDLDVGWRTLQFSQGAQRATASVRMSGPILTLRFCFGG